MKKIIVLFIVLVSLSSIVSAEDFGASGAMVKGNLSLEEMLNYAIEDEYLALTEYETLMEKFNLTRPYSNIAEAEKTHISYLEKLFKDYGFTIPEIKAEDHVYIPSNPLEAAQIGVEAEIKNIAMYEKFLKQELPADVREVFEILKKGSENHLKSFQRQVSMPQGRGQNRNS